MSIGLIVAWLFVVSSSGIRWVLAASSSVGWWRTTFSKVICKSVFHSEGETLAKFFFALFETMANPNAKPPKRKKSHSRKVKGGNKKRSSYDYSAARESLGLPTNATAQEISFHATAGDRLNDVDATPADKSPLKKEYKAMLFEERAKNVEFTAKAEKAEKAVESKERKIFSLKDENKQLAATLREDREKSRLTINKLISDAELVIEQANEIKLDAEAKMSAAELSAYKQKEKMQESVNKERQYVSAREAAREYFCVLSEI